MPVAAGAVAARPILQVGWRRNPAESKPMGSKLLQLSKVTAQGQQHHLMCSNKSSLQLATPKRKGKAVSQTILLGTQFQEWLFKILQMLHSSGTKHATAWRARELQLGIENVVWPPCAAGPGESPPGPTAVKSVLRFAAMLKPLGVG